MPRLKGGYWLTSGDLECEAGQTCALRPLDGLLYALPNLSPLASTGLPSQPLLAPLHPPQAYDVHWLAATVAGAAGVEALGEGYAAVGQAEELETASPEFEPEVRRVCLCRHQCLLQYFWHAPGHFGEPCVARPAVFDTTRVDELWIAHRPQACCSLAIMCCTLAASGCILPLPLCSRPVLQADIMGGWDEDSYRDLMQVRRQGPVVPPGCQ